MQGFPEPLRHPPFGNRPMGQQKAVYLTLVPLASHCALKPPKTFGNLVLESLRLVEHLRQEMPQGIRIPAAHEIANELVQKLAVPIKRSFTAMLWAHSTPKGTADTASLT
jgi:hypothetical protein